MENALCNKAQHNECKSLSRKNNLFITLPTVAGPHGRQMWKRAGSDWRGHHQPLRVTSCSGLETCSRVYEDIPLLRCCLCALTQILCCLLRQLIVFIPSFYCKYGVTIILEIAVLAAVEAVSVLVWSPLLVNTTRISTLFLQEIHWKHETACINFDAEWLSW